MGILENNGNLVKLMGMSKNKRNPTNQLNHQINLKRKEKIKIEVNWEATQYQQFSANQLLNYCQAKWFFLKLNWTLNSIQLTVKSEID